jgi:hypothetical protein
VAHILGWNQELTNSLRAELTPRSRGLAEMWAGWASEIAADCFAFVHTGYAAVAALHDVIAGESETTMVLPPGDPHPVAYLRVLLNTQMCKAFFGIGPWDDLATAWQVAHPLTDATAALRDIYRLSVEQMSLIVETCLMRPMRAFGNRPLVRLIDPLRVRPDALLSLAREAGPALYSSHYYINAEPLRLLALSGLRIASEPERAAEIAQEYESWMLRLGSGLRATA